MNQAIFLTVRTSSTRLPNKCLLKINSKETTLDFIIRRLKKTNYRVILCTSTNPKDSILAKMARDHKIDYFRGSEEDKLKRWIDCAKQYNIDFFVTADGDDLFEEPELIELAFKQFIIHRHPFIKSPSVPCGAFSWGIETKSLIEIYTTISDKSNTEMGFKYFKPTYYLMSIPKELKQNIRMTLDYKEDLEFFRQVVKGVGNASLRVILDYLKLHPEIIKINSFRQEDFVKNQNKEV